MWVLSFFNIIKYKFKIDKKNIKIDKLEEKLNTIIKNHNIHDLDPEDFKGLYNLATKKKGDFLMLDLKGGDKKWSIRHNFLDPLL